MTDHADIVREFVSALCGDDIRINGCNCSHESACYLHAVLEPQALAALDALVAERDAARERTREVVQALAQNDEEADALEARAEAAEAERDKALFQRDQWKEAAESQAKESVWWDRAEAAEAEVARLREALEQIGSWNGANELPLGVSPSDHARAALASGSEGGEEG
jgi:hypothetical protein